MNETSEKVKLRQQAQEDWLAKELEIGKLCSHHLIVLGHHPLEDVAVKVSWSNGKTKAESIDHIDLGVCKAITGQ